MLMAPLWSRICGYSRETWLTWRRGSRCGRCILFFFSSRRRHTRWTGDWSSDVCSSDLALQMLEQRRLARDFAEDEMLHAAADNGVEDRIAAVGDRIDLDHFAVGAIAIDRKSVVVGKECRCRWSHCHYKKNWRCRITSAI